MTRADFMRPPPFLQAFADEMTVPHREEDSDLPVTLHRLGCTPHHYPAGTTFVNQSHIVRILRNEGTVPAVVYVTWLVPVGANPIRVDEPAPGNCPF